MLSDEVMMNSDELQQLRRYFLDDEYFKAPWHFYDYLHVRKCIICHLCIFVIFILFTLHQIALGRRRFQSDMEACQ